MQKVQRCTECDQPTGRCEDDSLFVENKVGSWIGPLCEECRNYHDVLKRVSLQS